MFSCRINDYVFEYEIQNHPRESYVKIPCGMLAHYKDWIRFLPPLRTMWPKQIWPHTAAADACAHGEVAQIGVFIVVNSETTYWFSEQFAQSDFQAISIPSQCQYAA